MLVSSAEKRAVFAGLYNCGELRGAHSYAAEQLRSAEGDERLRWGNNAALALWKMGRAEEAVAQLDAVSSEADGTGDRLLAGNYQNNRAVCAMALWGRDEDEAQLDAALIAFEGAAYHYERTGDRALVASAKNNAAALLVALGRAAEAYPKLEEARSQYLKLGEVCRAAEVDETEARARLKAGETDRALTLAARAVAVLSEYGDGALAEAEGTLRAVLELRASAVALGAQA